MSKIEKRKIINTFGITGRCENILKSTAERLIPFATKSELAIEYRSCYDDKLCRVYVFDTKTSKFWISHTYAHRIYYSDLPKNTFHKVPMVPTVYGGDMYRLFSEDPYQARVELTPETSPSALTQFEGRNVKLETYHTDTFEGKLRILDKDKLKFKIEGDPHYPNCEFDYTGLFEGKLLTADNNYEEMDSDSTDMFRKDAFENPDVLMLA